MAEVLTLGRSSVKGLKRVSKGSARIYVVSIAGKCMRHRTYHSLERVLALLLAGLAFVLTFLSFRWHFWLYSINCAKSCRDALLQGEQKDGGVMPHGERSLIDNGKASLLARKQTTKSADLPLTHCTRVTQSQEQSLYRCNLALHLALRLPAVRGASVPMFPRGWV